MGKNMKIGIIGSSIYENKRKIKETIFNLSRKFNEDLIIFSGGDSNGAEKYVKKYALELGCKYIEVNPAHTQKNLYSYMRKEWYGKDYSVKHYHTRNKILAKSVDRLIAFVAEGDNPTATASVVKYALKLNKKVVVIT
tara:strand:- start:12489 stop:12902 length:414 start_codon:yes stop_codon:yes gene_type:complete